MITAADSSVLLDILGASARYGPASAQAMKRVTSEGQVVACPVVWSEVATASANEEALLAALNAIPVVFSDLDRSSVRAYFRELEIITP